MFIVQLPDIIIKEWVKSYLTHDDYRFFINASKKYFGSLKRETIYFALNEEKSVEYYQNDLFRERLLSLVTDGYKQISLNFNSSFTFDSNEIIAHKISCYQLEVFPDVEVLKVWRRFNTPEVPLPPRLKDLILYNCFNLTKGDHLSHLNKLSLFAADKLTDIKPLENIPYLHFYHCEAIQNFSILTHLKQTSLKIHNCPQLSDVSTFRNIRHLAVSFCPLVSDLSPLYGIYDLSLIGCEIKDISKLGGHHYLAIESCRDIVTGYECLLNIPHVTLRSCKIPNFEVLKYVKTLSIDRVLSFEAANEIKHARTVTLPYSDAACPVLKDIYELTFNSFEPPDSLQSISQMRNRRLTLHCDLLDINHEFPPQIQHFIIHRSEQIVQMIQQGKAAASFRFLHSLRIDSCNNLEHVDGLRDIPVLTVSFCTRLRNVCGLGCNRSVEISNCSEVTDVSSLATVPIVTLRNCSGIQDYSSLSKVPRLKILSYK